MHTLAPDFELLDLWRVPLDADPARGERFADFLHAFVVAGRGTRPVYPLRIQSGADAAHLVRIAGAGGLFALRRVLGRLFRLDEGGALPIPGRVERRVRTRLDDDDHRRDLGTLPPVSGIGFEPVYVFEEEALLEIANRTIHALLHLSWIPADEVARPATGGSASPGEAPGPDGGSARRDAAIAVYVKSRGLGSRVYLMLIRPFRHAVVYPAWIAHLARTWAVLRPTAARGDAAPAVLA